MLNRMLILILLAISTTAAAAQSEIYSTLRVYQSMSVKNSNNESVELRFDPSEKAVSFKYCSDTDAETKRTLLALGWNGTENLRFTVEMREMQPKPGDVLNATFCVLRAVRQMN
jgi:hypothetical protein